MYAYRPSGSGLFVFVYESLYSGLPNARRPPRFSILHTAGSYPLPILAFPVLNLRNLHVYILGYQFSYWEYLLFEMSYVYICMYEETDRMRSNVILSVKITFLPCLYLFRWTPSKVPPQGWCQLAPSGFSKTLPCGFHCFLDVSTVHISPPFTLELFPQSTALLPSLCSARRR